MPLRNRQAAASPGGVLAPRVGWRSLRCRFPRPWPSWPLSPLPTNLRSVPGRARNVAPTDRPAGICRGSAAARRTIRGPGRPVDRGLVGRCIPATTVAEPTAAPSARRSQRCRQAVQHDGRRGTPARRERRPPHAATTAAPGETPVASAAASGPRGLAEHSRPLAEHGPGSHPADDRGPAVALRVGQQGPGPGELRQRRRRHHAVVGRRSKAPEPRPESRAGGCQLEQSAIGPKPGPLAANRLGRDTLRRPAAGRSRDRIARRRPGGLAGPRAVGEHDRARANRGQLRHSRPRIRRRPGRSRSAGPGRGRRRLLRTSVAARMDAVVLVQNVRVTTPNRLAEVRQRLAASNLRYAGTIQNFVAG